MTPDDVRAAAERLVEFHERFAPLFGKEQAQDHAYDYVKGLMVCPERKSIEPIALNVGHGDVSACRSSSTSPPGTTTTSRPRSRPSSPTSWSPPPPAARSASSGSSTRAASPRRASTAPAWPGSTTAGSARRTTARSASSWSASPPAARRCWTTSSTCPRPGARTPRRAATAARRSTSPRGSPSGPSPDRRRAGPATVALGVVTLDWVIADEEYGRNGDFLDELETLEQRYVVEVPVTTTVWTEDPAGCVPPYCGRGRVPTRPSRASVRRVAAVAAALPPARWQALQVREGAKGPLVFEFAAVRVWAVRHRAAGPPVWLLIRRRWRRRPRSSTTSPTPTPRRRWGCWRWWPARGTGRGVLRGRQELPGDGAVRDAVVGRLAPSHEPGGDGSSVHDADAPRSQKKRRS